jgi:hypothetical protein
MEIGHTILPLRNSKNVTEKNNIIYATGEAIYFIECRNFPLVIASTIERNTSATIDQKIIVAINKSYAFVIVLCYSLISRNSARVI